MRKITEWLSRVAVGVSLFLYDKRCFESLADWLWMSGYRLRMRYQTKEVRVNTDDEWMYDWLFHYNSYTKVWRAYHREDSNAYWSGQAMRHQTFESNCVTGLITKLGAAHQSSNAYEYDNGY